MGKPNRSAKFRFVAKRSLFPSLLTEFVLSHAPLLVIDNVKRSFGHVDAVAGVSINLFRGERLALLGPNGAGKTTLIRILSGRCRRDSGSIMLDGVDIDRMGARDRLGWVPQEIALYGDLTTEENLLAFGRLYQLKSKNLRQRVDWALQWTGLSDRRNDVVGGFSGGMKRRVNLALGVLHEPEILFLDEPTVGVDPQSRHKIFEMLDELSSAGTAIVLTTHHLDEAQDRTDRIVIMDHGRIVADGTISDLIQQSVGPDRMVTLRIDRPLMEPIVLPSSPPSSKTSPPLPRSSTPLRTIGQTGQSELITRIDQVSDGLPKLLGRIRQNGYEVHDVEVHAPSLHHVFLHLTGADLRDGV